jgi:GGDEF domain-containing protein
MVQVEGDSNPIMQPGNVDPVQGPASQESPDTPVSLSEIETGSQTSLEVQLPPAEPDRRRSGRDRRATDRRGAEYPIADADIDILTGLYNDDAWRRLLETEDERRQRYDHTSCVLAVDLEGPGVASDSLICQVGQSIRAVTKERDFVARVGTEKFAVLVTECNSANSRRVLQRIRTALNKAGATASIGLARPISEKGLDHAWQEASRARHYRVP